jgi:hypothetical protein
MTFTALDGGEIQMAAALLKEIFCRCISLLFAAMLRGPMWI